MTQQVSTYLPGYYYLFCYNEIVNLQNKYPQDSYKDLCNSIKNNCRINFFKFNGFRLEDKDKINILQEELILIELITQLKINLNLSDWETIYLSYLENKLTHLQTKPEWICASLISFVIDYIIHQSYYCYKVYVKLATDFKLEDTLLSFTLFFVGMVFTICKAPELKKINNYIYFIFKKCKIFISKIKYYLWIAWVYKL